MSNRHLAPCVYRKVHFSSQRLASFGTGHCHIHESQGSTSPARAEKYATRPKRLSEFGACAEQPAATQEPGGGLFHRGHSQENTRPGLPAGITSEEKPNKLSPSPLQHISGLNHTFRSSRRFRSRLSLPVSLGSAAAGFFVRCSWFRRAPGVLSGRKPLLHMLEECHSPSL